jgi:hypothetical protein
MGPAGSCSLFDSGVRQVVNGAIVKASLELQLLGGHCGRVAQRDSSIDGAGMENGLSLQHQPAKMLSAMIGVPQTDVSNP